MVDNCEYTPNHEDVERHEDRPNSVTMVSVRHTDNPEACPSNANVKLCKDCAVEQGVIDE